MVFTTDTLTNFPPSLFVGSVVADKSSVEGPCVAAARAAWDADLKLVSERLVALDNLRSSDPSFPDDPPFSSKVPLF